MPNLDLKKHKFNVDDDIIKYFNGNNVVTYEYINKVKSELNNKSDKSSDDNNALNWINRVLKKEIDAVDAPKRIIMQTDGQGKKNGGNAYKKTHTKDKNANPTKVRIPKLHKGKVSRQIMTNKVQYESINDEYLEIKYLIEYMYNNKI